MFYIHSLYFSYYIIHYVYYILPLLVVYIFFLISYFCLLCQSNILMIDTGVKKRPIFSTHVVPLNNSFFSQVFRFFPQVYHSFFLLFFVFHSSLISLALFFSLNFIWFSHTSLGDNSLRIIFCSLCLKEMLFVNPSCIAFVSYCDTLYLDIHVRKKNI